MGKFNISYALILDGKTMRWKDGEELLQAKANDQLQQRLQELEERIKTAAAKHWLLQKAGKEQAEHWQVIVQHMNNSS